MEVERIAPGPANLDVAATLAELLHGIGEVEGEAILLGTDEHEHAHILTTLETGKVGRLEAFIVD